MIMKSGAKGADNVFEHLKWSISLPTKSMANDDFSEPPQRADSKNPIFIFAEFRVRATSGAWGSVSGGFWAGAGAASIEPFWGGGLARGLYRPPPAPQLKACPPFVV